MSLQIVNSNSLIGNCCFNGSLFVKQFDSNNNIHFSHYIPQNCTNFKIYCIYRSTPSRNQCFKSSLRITPINIDKIECDISENIVLYENIPNEDPRVMCLDDRLFVSYSKIMNHSCKYQNINIKIYGSFLNSTFEEKYMVSFDDLNSKSLKQKNWTFFEQDNIVYILYNIMPLEIYIWNCKNSLDKCKNILQIISRYWKHPLYPNIILRGGCPPILIDNIYYIFVHSIDYKIFCITIDNINFDILQITQTELIPNNDKNNIYFPCGVIFDYKKQVFYISLGINDIKLGILTILKDEIDNMMINVNNYDSVIFKDNILISDMIKSNMYLWINSWGGSGNDLFSNHLYTNGIKCKSIIWDKISCHCLKYHNLPIKKIYLITHPLIALSTMNKYNNQHTNFYKLSNQKNTHFTFTGLLYFMWIQLKNWTNQTNVYIIKESNLRNNIKKIETFIEVDNILNNYPSDKSICTNIQFIEDKFKIENYDIYEYLIENIIILYNQIED